MLQQLRINGLKIGVVLLDQTIVAKDRLRETEWEASKASGKETPLRKIEKEGCVASVSGIGSLDKLMCNAMRC